MSGQFSRADLLIDAEAYRICRLLSVSEFVRYCGDRNVNIGAERLRKLEQLRLFYPLLRIYRIDYIEKIEYVDDGRGYRKLGTLMEGEEWNGATRTQLAQIDFSARVIRSWREHGNVWDPAIFESPHIATIDSEPRRHEAFYSQFQLLQLKDLTEQLDVRVETDWAIQSDGTVASGWGDRVKKQLETNAERMIKRPSVTESFSCAGIVCQFISNRYYPQTQTDHRHRYVSTGGFSLHEGWDWYDYTQSWNARQALAQLKIDEIAITKLIRYLDAIERDNPLHNWSTLIQFVPPSKRLVLKGDALKHILFMEMRTMLALFYDDAFGTRRNADNVTRQFQVPDVDPAKDPMKALEQVANDFRVNPKPRVVLFVEGETELALIPRIFQEFFPANLSVYGIELVNVRGVGNATGPKAEHRSALWRLIDYLHHHQTIAFVLLDNEGIALQNIGTGLRTAKSIHFPGRQVTRPNYVKLWKSSIELDNFNDSELAAALTSHSHRKVKFTREEVKVIRQSAAAALKHGKVSSLSELYSRRTGEPLKKPQFALTLMSLMAAPSTKRKAMNRPIVRFLERVADAAASNHQPVSTAIWEFNQLTGHLGTLRAGAIGRRKTASGEPRPRNRKSK